MSYEKTFYIKENIIGYTGDINANPTVYFQNGDKFGRITQYHGNKGNIGRNKVREYEDYKITNEIDEITKKESAVEYYDGKDRHTSRSEFIKISPHTIETAAKSIDKSKYMKPKYKSKG